MEFLGGLGNNWDAGRVLGSDMNRKKKQAKIKRQEGRRAGRKKGRKTKGDQASGIKSL